MKNRKLVFALNGVLTGFVISTAFARLAHSQSISDLWVGVIEGTGPCHCNAQNYSINIRMPPGSFTSETKCSVAVGEALTARRITQHMEGEWGYCYHVIGRSAKIQ